jgi:hypothetical protein
VDHRSFRATVDQMSDTVILSALRTPGGRPAAAGHRCCLLRHPPDVVERPAQQHLDVGVEAAELVGRPAGERIMDGRVEAQRELLALSAHV